MATILIIDDEASIRRIVRQVLTREGHTVLEAADGREGVRLQRRERADLVITDLVMPEQEGIETIRTLLDEDPDVRIVAMSGGGRGGAESYLRMAELMGAVATLPKPFTLQKLRDTVRGALGGEDEAGAQPPSAG